MPKSRIPNSHWSILACPLCLHGLTQGDDAWQCASCGERYPISEAGLTDLRLRSPKQHVVEFTVGTPPVPAGFRFEPLQPHSAPAIDVSAVDVPWHFSPELLSYFPRASSASSFALDLGCGTGLHRAICEYAGFKWVGLDYGNPAAQMLADGHALPFQNESFDLVFSMAVLEHIRYPFVLGREVMRVLKPGGHYIGTVSFLEPFHGDSYYHHTHLGTYNTLGTAGFEVIRVAPSRTWSGLRAQATMGGLFPRAPDALGRALVWPLEQLHKLWWKAGRLVSEDASELRRLVTNTGSFEFVARKPRA
jgi:SAM-dependent methyltransferase